MEGAGAPQFRSEMCAAWDAVDEDYRSGDILGPTAADVIMQHAVRASHHEFPFGMTVMAQLFACTNGATTEVFPGVESPLVLPIISNNYPQTRKSSGFGTGNAIGHAIDDHVLDVAKDMVAQSLPDAAARVAPAVRIQSSTLSSFTEAAFFQRCAGDWCQIVPSEQHDVQGRCFSAISSISTKCTST